MASYLQKLRRQSKQLIPQTESKTLDQTAQEPLKAQQASEISQIAEPKAGPSDPALFPAVPTVAEPTEEPAAEAVLDEEDQRFLERLAAIADEPEGPAPELPTRPLQVVDSSGQKRVGRDAQDALLDGAEKIALPVSPPPVSPRAVPVDTSTKGKEKAKDKDKDGGLGRRKSVLSYFNMSRFNKKDGDKEKDKKQALMSAKDREQFADDLQAAAANAKNAELTEAEKEQHELTEILDQLNLSAVNNRVFSFSKESEQLLTRFIQVLKDLINGVPTAYNDLELLFTDYDNQLKSMYGSLPPFLQNIIKSLPAKLTATLGPGVLAASAEQPGFDAKQAAGFGSAAKKSRLPVVPNLKQMLASQGAVTTALRSIVNFLKFRFPALATGTNLIMSLAVFGKSAFHPCLRPF